MRLKRFLTINKIFSFLSCSTMLKFLIIFLIFVFSISLIITMVGESAFKGVKVDISGHSKVSFEEEPTLKSHIHLNMHKSTNTLLLQRSFSSALYPLSPISPSLKTTTTMKTQKIKPRLIF